MTFITKKSVQTLMVLTVLVGLFAFSMTPVMASLIDTVDTSLNYGTVTGLGTKDLREGIMAIVNVILGFLGIIAIIIILYGGFVWLTSAGNEEKVGQAKKIISAGIVGLVIIFISYAIVVFVIQELLTATGAS